MSHRPTARTRRRTHEPSGCDECAIEFELFKDMVRYDRCPHGPRRLRASVAGHRL